MTDAEIATNELLVVIEATSFTSGKGPLPPKCLKQDGAIFVTEFKEDTTAKDSLMGKFASVSHEQEQLLVLFFCLGAGVW
jgi:hypothetical protein